METSNEHSPFGELPQAMVQEMFDNTRDLSSNLSAHLSEIQENKEKIRSQLSGIIKRDSDIIKTPQFPTTCGTDGSYCADKLLATDVVAIAAVAVEGLTPPKLSEPIWPKPRHFVKVVSLPHDESTQVLAKAIMLSMEIQLASLAPHDVVFLDGSMTTITIAYNQAFGKNSPKSLKDFLIYGDTTNYDDDRKKFGPVSATLESYKEMIAGKRTDRMTVAIPKYSRRNEICESIGLVGHDDRGLLSMILSGGEFTSPIQIQKEGGGKWLTAKLPDKVNDTVEEIEKLLNEVFVVYYKPYENFPAIRLEMGKPIAENNARLAILLEAVKLQSGAPGMMEPYPTYLADRMVKHLSSALPAIRGFSISDIAKDWKGNIGDIYLATHSYRTEGYR